MIEIASGSYRAVVNPVGASIAALTHGDRDLLQVQQAAGAPTFHGAVLAPWPGRIGDGEYTFGGQVRELPITEPDRRTALHGLVYDERWDVHDVTEASTTLRTVIEPSQGYPHTLRLTVMYSLSDDGLTCDLVARNGGRLPAPYGCGFHPYVLPARGSVDGAEVLVPARQRLLTDARLLPTGVGPTAGTAYDLSAAGPLGDLVLDDAFTGLTSGPRGESTARVDDVEVWSDETLPWFQVYTDADRTAIAVEPFSCPSGAFVTRQDLVILDPGRSHTATWGVRLTS